MSEKKLIRRLEWPLESGLEKWVPWFVKLGYSLMISKEGQGRHFVLQVPGPVAVPCGLVALGGVIAGFTRAVEEQMPTHDQVMRYAGLDTTGRGQVVRTTGKTRYELSSSDGRIYCLIGGGQTVRDDIKGLVNGFRPVGMHGSWVQNASFATAIPWSEKYQRIAAACGLSSEFQEGQLKRDAHDVQLGLSGANMAVLGEIDCRVEKEKEEVDLERLLAYKYRNGQGLKGARHWPLRCWDDCAGRLAVVDSVVAANEAQKAGAGMVLLVVGQGSRDVDVERIHVSRGNWNQFGPRREKDVLLQKIRHGVPRGVDLFPISHG